MNILINADPWNGKQSIEMFKDIYPNCKIVTVSDYRGSAEYWFGRWANKKNKTSLKDHVFTDAEKEDIRIKCRYLRKIGMDEAYELVDHVAYYVKQLIDEYKIDFFYTEIPDGFTSDIVARLCKKSNIPVVCILKSFINGYSRFTVYGESIECRDTITEKECTDVIDMLLDNKYKPSFELNNEISRMGYIKKYIRRQAIDKVAFPIIQFLKNDRYNRHYHSLRYDTNNINDYFPGNYNEYFKKIRDIKTFDKAVYIPLHYTPEATVDYWCPTNHVYYEDFILDFIKKSDSEIQFILKEHPAMYGARKMDFYDKLVNIDNVILIHPYENSNELLQKIDNVLVTTGSVGVEALLRHKNVFTTSENYYSKIFNLGVYECLNMGDIQKQNKISDDEIYNCVEELLKCHFNMELPNLDNKKLKEYIEYAFKIKE